MSQRGKFISLEGGEGVGKSTQVRALSAALEARGIDVLVTREPGGSPGAEQIRKLLLDPQQDWSMTAEALLFAAARTDHVEKTIEPALAAGKWILADRFLDSSLAYQGGAGGLGIAAVRAINASAVRDCMPDRSLVLRLTEGADRARVRDAGDSDRIGGRGDDYHSQVDRAFEAVAAEEPERVRLIDAAGTPKEVTDRLMAAIADLLP